LIPKYILTLITGHCCPIHTAPLPSLSNESSISANAGSTNGTEFLELHAGQSVIIPEFQGHPENDTLTAAISFSETRRNYKGPSEV